MYIIYLYTQAKSETRRLAFPRTVVCSLYSAPLLLFPCNLVCVRILPAQAQENLARAVRAGVLLKLLPKV